MCTSQPAISLPSEQLQRRRAADDPRQTGTQADADGEQYSSRHPWRRGEEDRQPIGNSTAAITASHFYERSRLKAFTGGSELTHGRITDWETIVSGSHS